MKYHWIIETKCIFSRIDNIEFDATDLDAAHKYAEYVSEIADNINSFEPTVYTNEFGDYSILNQHGDKIYEFMYYQTTY